MTIKENADRVNRALDIVIMQYYEKGGAIECIKHCRGKTRKQITRRANHIGIRMLNENLADNKGRKTKWATEGWDAILQECYHDLGIDYCMKRIPRNRKTISGRAHYLGLSLSKEARHLAHVEARKRVKPKDEPKVEKVEKESYQSDTFISRLSVPPSILANNNALEYYLR